MQGFPETFRILREAAPDGPGVALFGNAVSPPVVAAIAEAMLAAVALMDAGGGALGKRRAEGGGEGQVGQEGKEGGQEEGQVLQVGNEGGLMGQVGKDGQMGQNGQDGHEGGGEHEGNTETAEKKGKEGKVDEEDKGGEGSDALCARPFGLGEIISEVVFGMLCDAVPPSCRTCLANAVNDAAQRSQRSQQQHQQQEEEEGRVLTEDVGGGDNCRGGGGGGGGRSDGRGGVATGVEGGHVCYVFRDTGACEWGDRCRFAHDS
jgi:hypothetical protein